MGTLLEHAAIDVAVAQFAIDHPDDTLWKDPGVARLERDRVVVRLLYKPRGKQIMPAPARYYAVELDCSAARQLNSEESRPYWPRGPRK